MPSSITTRIQGIVVHHSSKFQPMPERQSLYHCCLYQGFEDGKGEHEHEKEREHMKGELV